MSVFLGTFMYHLLIKCFMKYPSGVGRKHSNTGRVGNTILTRYGYNEDGDFVTEKIGEISSFFHLYRLHRKFWHKTGAECDNCGERYDVVTKDIDGREYYCPNCPK